MFNSKRLRIAIVVGSMIVINLVAVTAESGAKSTGDELLALVPAESLFCVRVNNIDHTLGQIDQFLLGASPMPMWLSMMVRGHLTKLFGSPELNGVNMNGSLAMFGTIAPSEPVGEDFISMLIPVTDYKKLVSENPNIIQPDANGVSTIKDGPILMQVGNFALLKWQKSYDKLIETTKSMSSGKTTGLAGVLDADELNKATKEPIWAYGNVQLASKAFGPMLLGKIEEAKKMMESMKASGKGPMGSPAVIMNIYAGILETLMKEIKSLSVTIEPKPSVCELSFSISAVPETDMAKMFVSDASAEQENKLLAYLKDGAMINLGCKMNTPFARQFDIQRVDLIGSMAGKSVTSEDIAKMKKLATDAYDSIGNSAVFSFSIDSGNKPPFALRYVAEVKDAEKFNKVIEEAANMINTGSVDEFYKSFGMKMSFDLKRGVDRYEGISIDSAKLVMKSTEPNTPQGQMINAMFGEGFNYRWAIADELWVCAVAKDPNSAIRELIDEVKAGGPKQLASEMKSALTLIPEASKADFVGTYNYLRLFGMITAFMPMPMPKMDIPTKSNIAFAGKAGSGKMSLRVAFPKEHLMEIMGFFQKMQQQEAPRQTSAVNLRQIGLACVMYADDHDGKFPPNLQELAEKNYIRKPDILESPRKPADFDGPSYIYISGHNTSTPPDNILVYENPEFCSDRINVLFMDSHVEAIKPDAFLQKLEETYKWLGRAMPDIKFKDSTKPTR